MTELELLVDLHLEGRRQGPGSNATTLKALELTDYSHNPNLQIADIGCGTGSSALLLAEQTGGRVTAIDLFPEFLDRLTIDAAQNRLAEQITARVMSMDDLKFGQETLDLIWSEGAIYNIGFQKGARYWGQFLKPGGVLAVSEITWLKDNRPAELEEYWHSYYPEIDNLENKTCSLEKLGYSIISTFILPESCWEDEYYKPLESRYDDFLERHWDIELAHELVATDREEIKMYRKYKDYYGYAFYIARKK
jgi:SAM-dependent methyltransferase